VLLAAHPLAKANGVRYAGTVRSARSVGVAAAFDRRSEQVQKSSETSPP
jgi:hypothetical protein